MSKASGTLNKALAALVRAEREKRNWTQEHLAVVADVSTRTIQRFETDGSHSRETLRSVAAAFDVDCQDILKRAREQPTQPSSDEPDPFLVVHLSRCYTGKALFDGLDSCHAHHSDYPEDLSQERAEAVGWLFDFVRDYSDIHNDISPSHRIKYEQEITAKLSELGEMGLGVFCGAYRKKFTVANSTPMDWRVAIVTVIEINDPRIVKAGDRVQMLPALVPKKQHAMF
jgi:transcriptional regulator with XRE-family HTH domain